MTRPASRSRGWPSVIARADAARSRPCWTSGGPHEGPRDGWQLDEDAMTMVSINSGEWLISRGEIHARGGLREINAYLSGREGPFLAHGQREWIARLRAGAVRLYRVTDVQPGAGMTLIDEFDPQAQPQPVREISGSRSARPGMLMGARIMKVATGAGTDGHRELSGGHLSLLRTGGGDRTGAGPAGAGRLCRVRPPHRQPTQSARAGDRPRLARPEVRARTAAADPGCPDRRSPAPGDRPLPRARCGGARRFLGVAARCQRRCAARMESHDRGR